MRPNRLYHVFKAQLGSIRNVYLPAQDISVRRDYGPDHEIVLLLHGFFQTRNIWEVMERRLRYDGYSVMSFNLKSTFTRLNTKPVKAQARMIAEKIETLTQRYGFSAVHIVGHSKGGLVARKYIQHFGGSKRTKSLITLGSPHHGTPTALAGLALLALSSNPRELLPRSTLVRSLNRDTFPAHIPLTSVYSKADVICPNRYSILRPRPGESSMENIEIRGVGHSQLTWDLSVYRVVQERLRRASELWADRQTRA